MGRKRKGGGNDERRIRLDDAEIIRLFSDGATAAEMAVHFACSVHPIKKAMRRLNLRRPAKRRPGKGLGSDNTQWKGGRRTRIDGYIVVWTPDGEVLEHRVVAEKALGRKLLSGEVVHHKDGDKSNNIIDNLEVMSQSDHARLHAPAMHAARYGK